MAQHRRLLGEEATRSLADHLDRGSGLERARSMSPSEILDRVDASGLRGRGGAGFPTGRKWRTVAEMSATTPASVVVNGAEGEPGSFKDRTILSANPYQVIEGALIAAHAVGATDVVVAVKDDFTDEIARLSVAIDEFDRAGLHDVTIRIVTGPSSYLFGEESALLEVIDGRPPLPRVNPPYRRGIGAPAGDANSSSATQLAGDEGVGGAPALVNNVETLAHVSWIFREGVEAFRSVGTAATPGTTVCTVSGAVGKHGVGEFTTDTSLWEVIDTVGGGPRPERTLIGAISGTANAVLTADRFDTPLCFDAMRDAGSGLGASGFVLFDDATDFAAVAHGVARFLAIESCGQCEPCKLDGAKIADRLDTIRRSDPNVEPATVEGELEGLFSTVADGARCGLAAQHQSAVASLHRLAVSASRSHLSGALEAADLELIAPIVGIVDGEAQVDRTHLDKALDWSLDGSDSGAAPADRRVEVRR